MDEGAEDRGRQPSSGRAVPILYSKHRGFRPRIDHSFPRHAHDGFGIGVLTEGAHRSWSGIGHVEAVAGDVITVNPGEMHDGDPVRGAARSWRMLYLDPSLVAQALRQELRWEAEITRPVLHDPLVATLFEQLFVALTEPIPDALGTEEGLLRLLALLLARHGSRPLPVAGPPPPVALALRRLAEAPERPATLTELAALSGVSRFQLLRGFARAVGVTPHAYLLQQRVRLAQRLLAAGQRPAEAAAGAGFPDQSHLTRAFRRQLGVTPARYRAAVA
ncbi:helix-turn-helix transcriptional regulator [Roseomonas haemaphysalidis]|uniref:helix-turn-helix transcriptional regulator n=1 Tax=Roseomonas haemaphysalidis TaxID=2768162 RepID=UPI001A961C26|nr:AraC family transcriptional regulator [Roseomonas haemaphysalidis]